MSLIDLIQRYLVVFVVGLTIAISTPAHSQTTNTGSRNVQRQRPRMKVIEIVPQKQTSHYYTILGAVKRSGVFYDKEVRVSLEKLLDAAGGLVAGDRSSIRIVRNGQSGLQLYYLSDQKMNQEIQSGDLIIVVPAAEQSSVGAGEDQYIPVACIGISDRPVVLPLLANIKTVDQLLFQLGQPQSLKETIRVLDPLGKPQAERLIPGSVVFFDQNSIDRVGLDTVKSFPPAVPLVSLKQDLLPKDESLLDRADQNSNQGIAIQPAFGQPQVNTESLPDATLEGVGKPDNVPALLVNPEQPVITVEKSETVSANQIPFQPDTLVADKPQETFSLTHQIPKLDIDALDLLPEEDDPTSTSTLLTDSQEDEVAGNDSSSIAPPPPIETRVLRSFKDSKIKIGTRLSSRDVNDADTSHVILEADNVVSAIGTPRVAANTKAHTPVSYSQYFPIVLSLGGLGILGLLGSIVWSRNDRHKQRRQNVTSRKERLHSDSEKSLGAKMESDQLQTILAQSTPTIEEVVVLPKEIHIHGEPIGHRRIIIHDREEALRGPHFIRSKVTPLAQHAQQATQSSTSQSKKADKRTVPQAATNTQSPGYDVVEIPDDLDDLDENVQQTVPEPKLETESSTTTSGYDVITPSQSKSESQDRGPLVRALSILARERTAR